MATTYKTPGVYIEEITKLPPSVAAVETAIPAFIGYTERATKDIPGDLLKIPTKIRAIADYERFFGGPFSETSFAVTVDDSIDPNTGLLIRTATVPRPGTLSPFIMAYSIQMYFANGGGPCYIISVGTYKNEDDVVNTISASVLGTNTSGDGGLDLLKLEDEPTLIVFPDAQALSDSQFYSLNQSALAQCNKLKDRFAIIDTKGDSENAPALLRDNIGTNFLKYGAVYYPFIESVLNYAYRELHVSITHNLELTFNLPATTIVNITAAMGIINTAEGNMPIAGDIQNAIDAVVTIGGVGAVAGKVAEMQANFLPLIDNVQSETANIVVQLATILSEAEAFNNVFDDPDVQSAIDAIGPTIIAGHDTALSTLSGTISSFLPPNPAPGGVGPINTAANSLNTPLPGPAIDAKTVAANLVSTLIPALTLAISGNDPINLVTQIETEFANFQTELNTMELINVNTVTLVNAVTDVAVTDANALVALQSPNLADANSAAVLSLTSLVSALNISIQTAQNATQIPLIQSTLMDTVNAIDLSNLNAILGELNTLANPLTGIPSAVVGDRTGINTFANTFGTQMGLVETELLSLTVSMTSLFNGVSYLNLNGNQLNDIENIDNTTYNQIKFELEKIRVLLPPSSSMAGIYAQTDRNRGVWKAPANLSVSSVIAPTQKIDNDIQDGLNVDVVAGKSINALRAFAGKGTMVWGARTLAGNDNEWRYISVRRFFNFVEESVKKSTEVFIFEPNDANTWVRVQAMIENFLILQWRAGALAGAKPAHAFYVEVGLGETMTALDILEGRMIVEIGMAVVRPAEFNILRFSHKMQES